MASKTPTQAVHNYLEPLQKAVSCVTDAVLTVSGGYYVSDQPHSLTFGDGLPQKLPGSNIHLSVTHRYRVVEDEDPDKGPWRVTLAQYSYALRRGSGAVGKPERMLTYQWHPRPDARFNYPHVHLGPASGAHEYLRNTHVPTGRVALEDVIRYAISQLGVRALRGDWMDVLVATQGRFESYQSWSGSGP